MVIISIKSAGKTPYIRVKCHENYADKKGGKYLSLAKRRSSAH